MHLSNTKQTVDDIESTSDGDIIFPDWSGDRETMHGDDTYNELGSTLAAPPVVHNRHRKQQHSRTLSDIFTKLTAVVTDPFEHEDDYDASSVDPLQSVSIQDAGLQSPIVQHNLPHYSGKKHRRVFSSDRVQLSMAHRRMDSIGHSFFVHRNLEGNERASPLLTNSALEHPQAQEEPGGASHRRIDSAGLDLLTVAAHAFHDEKNHDSDLVLPKVLKPSFAEPENRSHSAHNVSWNPDRIREFPEHRVYKDDYRTSHPDDSRTLHTRSQRSHHPQPIFRDRVDRSLESKSYPYQQSKTAVYPMQHSKLEAETHDDYYHEQSHYLYRQHYSNWEDDSIMGPPAPIRKKPAAQGVSTSHSSSSNPRHSNRHVTSSAFSLPTSNPSRSQSHPHVSWAQNEQTSNLRSSQGHSTMYRQDSSWYGSNSRSTFHYENNTQQNANTAWKNAPSHPRYDSRLNGSNFSWNPRRDSSNENSVEPTRHKRLTTADMILNDLNADSAFELDPSLRNLASGATLNNRNDRNDVSLSGPAASILGISSSDEDANPIKRVINGGTSKRVRRKCEVEGCTNRTVQGGRCIGHGAKRRICGYPGCTKHVKKAGMCSTHGPARKRCSVDGCGKVAVQGGRCVSHGAKKKTCSISDCSKQATLFGMCKRHHDAIKGQASPTTSEDINEDTTTPQFHSQVCLPVSSSSDKNEKSHQRGLSIFHDMITVDSILASAASEIDQKGDDDLDVNVEASEFILTGGTLDSSLVTNAVSI